MGYREITLPDGTTRREVPKEALERKEKSLKRCFAAAILGVAAMIGGVFVATDSENQVERVVHDNLVKAMNYAGSADTPKRDYTIAGLTHVARQGLEMTLIAGGFLAFAVGALRAHQKVNDINAIRDDLNISNPKTEASGAVREENGVRFVLPSSDARCVAGFERKLG